MRAKKVLAMYIRLSIEDGDLKASDSKKESNSVSNQRKLLSSFYYAQLSEEYDVIEFCDDGYSGTNFNRPQFQIMMEKIKAREVHCILVKDLSRFGREYLEVSGYLELILPLFGTRFISVNDNFDSNDYIGTTGGLELALRNLINGMYSQDLSVKVRSAIRTRNKQGQYCGGYCFYGYLLDPEDKHRLIVDESVRHIIVRIFDECIGGKSLSQIAAGLNEDGVPTPSEHKAARGQKYNGRMVEDKPIWLNTTVRQILADERYTGKMVSGKRETVHIGSGKMRSLPREEWIIVKGTHEAIISDEIFVQAVKARESRIRTVNDNTSGNRAGNLFVCGYCGRKLQKSNGKVTHLYCLKSKNAQDATCAGVREPMEDLQANALTVVRTFAKTLLDQNTQKQAEADTRIPILEKEIRRLQDNLLRIQNGKLDLYERYRSGHITREKFAEMQKNNTAAASELQLSLEEKTKQLEKLESSVSTSDTECEDIRSIWQLSEYQPETISKVVERILVYEGGRMELELKSKSPICS